MLELPAPPYAEGTVVGFQAVDGRFIRLNTKQEVLDLIELLKLIAENWNVIE